MNSNFPMVGLDFYVAAAPILLLSVGALIVLMQAVFPAIGKPNAVFATLLGTLVLAGASLTCARQGHGTVYLNGAYLAGDLSRFAQAMILAIAGVVTLLFKETHAAKAFLRGEIGSLFLMVIAGMLVMVSTDDLVTLFVGLELASIGLYALIGYLAPSRRSQEGAIKYFVLGSFAAAVLLFGFSLLYAGVGTMRISELIAALPKVADNHWIKLGSLFTMIGLAFKLALVPFHLWTPDAYEAAPTGITALMATSVKIMIIIVSLRIFGEGFNSLYQVWLPAMMVLSIASMILGNIMALVQTSLKRMLAYSSIAHSGYMAIAICALSGTSGTMAMSAILFYLVGYAVVSLGAFGVLMWLENEQHDNLTLDDLSGLAAKHPWAAFALSTFMLSFAGMPPTVGFMGKFFVFNAALSNQLYAIVLIGVIGSTIALFYYLRVIVKMYMTKGGSIAIPLTPVRSNLLAVIMVVAFLVTLLLGTLLPGSVMDAVKRTTTELAKI